MPETLVILEISRKQDYIFSSKLLRENVRRSNVIRYLTSSSFFASVAPNLYDEENLVYAGGGHTVLQFEDRSQATAFLRTVTERVLRDYPALEMFGKQIPYDPAVSPRENLLNLTKALESKKSRRSSSFRRLGLGVESELLSVDPPVPDALPQPPKGYHFPSQFEELAGEDNFLAVVHADGNAMGKRTQDLYKKLCEPEKGEPVDWDEFCCNLQYFSDGIDEDFRTAFKNLITEILPLAEKGVLPLRPIVMSGDDVCFVTQGKLGLELGRIFLEKLCPLINLADDKGYSACVGVAMVHQKYPFYRAYQLSEELCSSAKKYGTALDPDGGVSAIDWHIEFGQLKENLAELRKDYLTTDGDHLELRPVVVLPSPAGKTPPQNRRYSVFRSFCRTLQEERDEIPRGKLKELRTALKQGRIEADFYLKDTQMEELLYQPFHALYPDWESKKACFQRMLAEGLNGKIPTFIPSEGEDFCRCQYFDAIELLDHYTPIDT